MKRWITILILFTFYSFGQDQLILDSNGSLFDGSLSKGMTIFETSDNGLTTEEFLKQKKKFSGRKMTQGLENLDFTSSSYFVHFTLTSKLDKDAQLVLETARPITNVVELYCVETQKTVWSGDAMPFNRKSIPSNFSVLPISLPANQSHEYVLKVTSDGEGLTLPIVFHKKRNFDKMDRDRQMIIGGFLGMFLFVVIIYFGFFVMLRESLFLLYISYVFFSGLMQFGFDGYFQKFLFTSGGYFSQHIILINSGITLVFGLFYATRFLKLEGTLRKVAYSLILINFCIAFISLFPGGLYEIAYPLMNGSGFLSLIFMLIAAYLQGKKQAVNKLFFIGLSCVVVGGTVYILGNFGVIDLPLITLNSLKAGTLMEMVFLSILMAGRYKILQEERERAQTALLIELEENNRIVRETNERLEAQVAERTKEIESQGMLLKEKNEAFMSSITYAKRIQQAVLSNQEKFSNILPESFVFFQPKDVVSGDFYWIDSLSSKHDQNGDFLAYVTADCTGHGVPGALVSFIGNHLLDSEEVTRNLMNPGAVLDALTQGMNAALNSRYSNEHLRDGMDLAFCLLDKKERILYFSGAKNSAYVIRNGELIELKGDRKSIGFDPKEESHSFQTQTLKLEIGDMIFTCSDGYADQFGGGKGKKFMSKQLKRLFIEISVLSMEEQSDRLRTTLEEWMGDNQQLDDILIIGVRITE